MKSIKEKAEEYAKTKHTSKTLIDIVSWDFEAGANYVLGEILSIIEPIIETTDGGILDESNRYYDENIEEIYNTIKELERE